MRKMVLFAVVVAAVAALLPASARPAVGGSDLPFKSTASGYFTVNLATGESHIVGTGGQLTHFGLWTTEEHSQIVPTTPGEFAEFSAGHAIAANGDQDALYWCGQRQHDRRRPRHLGRELMSGAAAPVASRERARRRL